MLLTLDIGVPMHNYVDAISLQVYQNLDMAIFIKNKKSQYLWGNRFFIKKSAGLSTVNDIHKKKDHDFSWHKYADELITNDKLLFESEKSVSVRERVIRHEGNYIDIISKKCPLFDSKKKIIGLIGFSIEIPVSSVMNALSKREYEAVILMSEGYTDKEIAKKWQLSPRTVESYLVNAKQKLGAKNRAELISCLHRKNP